MKKKIICLLLVVSILTVGAFALTACGKEVKPGYTPSKDQATVLTELSACTSDVGILDSTMAKYLIEQGGSISKNLMIVDSIKFKEEDYGVAFRKGSKKLCDEVNKAMSELKTDGEIGKIATKYGLQNNVRDLTYTAPTTEFTENDVEDFNAIKNKGKIVVGYTLNPPMAIKNGDTISGFDIELPKTVLKKVFGFEDNQIEFQIIKWENKENELNSGNIDCIWNGMTITPEREAAFEVSNPYLLNQQVVVIRKDDAKKYTTLDSLKSARVTAEAGSAGEEIAKGLFD